VSIDERLGLCIESNRAEGVDRYENIWALDVGAVGGWDGERSLIKKEVEQMRAVEPILQGALPALPLRDALQRDFRLRRPAAT
jgi:hypothetical protein